MSRSVAELPKVAGTCPEPLTAAIRRAVRSGGSWQETSNRVIEALRHRVPGPGLLTAKQLAGDPGGYQTYLVHAEPDGSFSVRLDLPNRRQVIPLVAATKALRHRCPPVVRPSPSVRSTP